jgi:hypothetical protein
MKHNEMLLWLASNWSRLERQANASHRVPSVMARAASQTERLKRADLTSMQITRKILWHADFIFQPVLSRSNPTGIATGVPAVSLAIGKHARQRIYGLEH